MYSKIFFLFLFFSVNLFAQEEEVAMDTLRITLKPAETTTRLVLYSAKGAQQKYVSYVDAIDGNFKLPIPKESQHGMYRLVFDQATMKYIDFLYVGKELVFTFDPTNPQKAPEFNNSPENTTYFTKIQEFDALQKEIDNNQVAYFQTQDSVEKIALTREYNSLLSNLQSKKDSFMKSTSSNLVKDLILAAIQVKPQTPIENPNEYLPFVKSHYFDHVDFGNTNLVHSSVLIDKVMDYVFYLTVSNDIKTQNEMYKTAVKEVLQKIDNDFIRKGFILALLQSFAKEENIVVADYLFEFYDALPLDLQNASYRAGLQQELKTAIGRTAPDFGWKEEEKILKLSTLEGYDNYIVVFWSSTCPHCLAAIPKLYEYIKDNTKTKVILVGLETEESQGSWKSETYYYPEFTHVLALDKWENPIVRSYNVHATPSYFVLDANKIIIDKPYELADLKVFFKDLKK